MLSGVERLATVKTTLDYIPLMAVGIPPLVAKVTCTLQGAPRVFCTAVVTASAALSAPEAQFPPPIKVH